MKETNGKRTPFGVGPKWAIYSILASLPVILITITTYPRFVMEFLPVWIFQVTGVVLILAGIFLYIAGAKSMFRAFKSTELLTDGVFGICRNPIYSSWMIGIMPGIAILFRVPILLIAPVIMYIFFRIMIKHEEKVLVELFGDEYISYQASVNAVFPTLRR